MRTKTALKNSTITIITNILCFLCGYISRMMLARYLSQEYLGLSGLFQDIISVLSISELGIATAMSYALYKPVAEDDTEHIQKLLQLYKRMYLAVAAFITAAGFAVVPFLPKLIGDYGSIPHIARYYLMYLAPTVLSYFCYYKTAVLYAYQKQYVMNLYTSIGQIARYAVQLAVLCLTKNFTLYVAVQAVISFLPNYFGSRRAEKEYPFIRENRKELPPKEERHAIYKNIFAMSAHKIGTVLVNNTDSLIMSSFLGLGVVGIVSNYKLIINALTKAVRQAVDSISATVGNLGAVENSERVYRAYRKVYFLCSVCYSYCCVMMALLFSDYILLGFGTKYLLPVSVSTLMIIDFYTKGMRTPTLCFRDAMGIFWYDRYKPAFEVVINLVTSIILVQKTGVSGIILGTLISFFTTSFIVDPYVWFRYGIREKWKKRLAAYFAGYLLDAGKTVLTALICLRLCKGIAGNGIMVIAEKGFLGTAVCAVCFFVLFLLPEWARVQIQKKR